MRRPAAAARDMGTTATIERRQTVRRWEWRWLRGTSELTLGPRPGARLVDPAATAAPSMLPLFDRSTESCPRTRDLREFGSPCRRRFKEVSRRNIAVVTTPHARRDSTTLSPRCHVEATRNVARARRHPSRICIGQDPSERADRTRAPVAMSPWHGADVELRERLPLPRCGAQTDRFAALSRDE